MDSTNLARFESDNGIEILIDTLTGASFLNVMGLARLAERNKSTIQRFLGSRKIDGEMVEIPTPGGLQGSRIFDEDVILDVLEKYNTPTLKLFSKLGTRVALHGMAGYSVTSEAVKPKQPVEEKSKPGYVPATDTNLQSMRIGLQAARHVGDDKAVFDILDMVKDQLGMDKGTKFVYPQQPSGFVEYQKAEKLEMIDCVRTWLLTCVEITNDPNDAILSSEFCNSYNSWAKENRVFMITAQKFIPLVKEIIFSSGDFSEDETNNVEFKLKRFKGHKNAKRGVTGVKFV